MAGNRPARFPAAPATGRGAIRANPPEGGSPTWLHFTPIMSLAADPGRAVTGHATSQRAAPVPRTERELVALLDPESPLLFAWARRALREIAGEAAGRFLTGQVAPGSWSVLRGTDEWLVVHRRDDGSPDEVIAFDTARSAVADAMAGVLTAANVEINNEILNVAGILRWDHETGLHWRLTDAGLALGQRAGGPIGPRAHGRYLPIETFEERPLDYFVCVPGPPPRSGPFVSVHEVFTMAARNMLPPDAAAEPGVDLSEGTVLDGYGDQDQVFLFTPQTPFVRRGLWGMPGGHRLRTYRVRRPLRVYPGFPIAGATYATGRPRDDRGLAGEGQGYYLIESIAEYVRSGDLTETSGPGEGKEGA